MAFPKPNFPADAIAAAKAACIAGYPNEVCGLIIDGAYVACQNIAADPTKDFKVDPAAVVAAGNNLQCVIHSHPEGQGIPSANDMQSQIDSAVIWGIVVVKKDARTGTVYASDPVFWGDYRLEEPLIGRDFIHGIHDCGSIIRSYFWQTLLGGRMGITFIWTNSKLQGLHKSKRAKFKTVMSS